ncbi:uncharacterized protein METZ01_LOCUS43115 [marine metagenome]|uniref:DUF1330 domain-containing protein n=1 Tax=marine metagenome TaxID=408172 RepID=A0A381RFK7_9ZZZZ|tara:strand:- start:87 stop:407 length:321 start_codon:yes stop_codon:yes gene_type:complete
MKKGYWSGQVIEVKNLQKWQNYLNKYTVIAKKAAENNTGNYKAIGMGEPTEMIQGDQLMYAALVEFNSLQDALDCYHSDDYQNALRELGDNPEETVIRNLAIVEGV